MADENVTLVNLDDKVKSIANRLISVSERWIQNMNEAREILKLKEGSGIDLADYEALFASTEGLKHVDSTILNSILSSNGALETWVEANWHVTNWQKARRG
jgi:ribosomal protein L19E